MKISYNWLKTLVTFDLGPVALAERLTAGGLEVEGIETVESIPGGLKGLLVGKVMSCEKHPDADRLSLTKVDVGSGNLLSIVCGAPNVAEGQKVIVATVGTKLFPVGAEPFDIKKSKIRGAVSEGMLCAEDEIGLGSSHAGIMVLPPETPVGMAASDYFNLQSDIVFEIGLTPNRSDAASHLGVARDVVAILKTAGIPVSDAPMLSGLENLPPASNTTTIKLSIKTSAACKRYSGIVISGITVEESPDWIKQRLLAIGVRPINNIVDITNFVLHEMGQPLHAFDLEKIKGREIVVRYANSGETFVTLDGVNRQLQETDLMICDAEQPMCIAGVFGGAQSGVSDKTTSVFIESAYFDAAHVRRSSKFHGLKTDASFRFERGTDPEITVAALIRCCNLILQTAGGTVATDLIDYYPEKIEPYKVAFSFANCRELIGKDIDRATIVSIIKSLGITIETEGNDGLLLSVPIYKTDVTREADVIEEVMRIYGYNNIEVSKHISYTSVATTRNFDEELQQRVTGLLEGFGYYEMMNLSLSSDNFYDEKSELVYVVNPLSSDLNVLRGDLLYGGLKTVAHNINRQQRDLKLFEFGRTYAKTTENNYLEEKQLLLIASGNLFSQNPHQLSHQASVVYLRGVCEQLAIKCGVANFDIKEFYNQANEPGVEAFLNNKWLFRVNAVSKKTLKQFEIDQDVVSALVNWSYLVRQFAKHKTTFSELSKFPSVKRDLSLLVNRDVKFSTIQQLAFSTEKKLLTEVNLFDIYEGEKLGDKKSYAVSFTLLNKEATLTDKQIEAVMEKLITVYKDKLGAILR